MDKKGFTIEVTSRYDGWWRYNAALMCGCFAAVGANLAERPADIPADRRAVLETMPCDHLVLYLYLIPHTLPAGNDIDTTRPFEIELRISYAGRLLRTERRAINQWSGASIELRVESGK